MLTYRNVLLLPRHLTKLNFIIFHPYTTTTPTTTATTLTTTVKYLWQHNLICQKTVIPLSQPCTVLNRYFSHSAVNNAVDKKENAESNTLTDYQAYDMIHKLSDLDRASLTKALNQYESNKIKTKFQGELASSKWRLRFGRRGNVPALGSVDPTGSYCAMPDDWLQKKLAEATVSPPRDALISIILVNGLPFVGFGFLDNFLMIIMGDYIEGSIGVYMCLSTMAAAALGNTISDVMGLGLAHYVEQFFYFLGMKEPKLTPTQMKMTITQRCASMGRVIGITVGCLLGMLPLLFIDKPPVVDATKTN